MENLLHTWGKERSAMIKLETAFYFFRRARMDGKRAFIYYLCVSEGFFRFYSTSSRTDRPTATKSLTTGAAQGQKKGKHLEEKAGKPLLRIYYHFFTFFFPYTSELAQTYNLFHFYLRRQGGIS